MAGYWSLHNNMNDTVRIIFGFGLVVVALLAVGLFVVRASSTRVNFRAIRLSRVGPSPRLIGNVPRGFVR